VLRSLTIVIFFQGAGGQIFARPPNIFGCRPPKGFGGPSPKKIVLPKKTVLPVNEFFLVHFFSPKILWGRSLRQIRCGGGARPTKRPLKIKHRLRHKLVSVDFLKKRKKNKIFGDFP